ncbi:hypothetical protein JCM10213v2_006053 [Rhodosporidiobolus nylandii]
MAPTLPAELQLYILDLFIASLPRPTSRNLKQRRQLLEPLTLVHRDWTPKPQQELRRLLSLRYLQAIELLGDDDAPKPSAEDAEKFNGRCGTPFFNLHRLSICSDAGKLPSLPRISLHSLHDAPLTHLYLDSCVVSTLPILPHLRTFLLGKGAYLPSLPEWLVPSLEVFGWDSIEGRLSDGRFLEHLPSTLKHLWMSFGVGDSPTSAISTLVQQTTGLLTLTVCWSNGEEPNSSAWADLQRWCLTHQIVLTVLNSRSDDVNAVEEWQP